MIMAGGRGSRLAPYTTVLPKPLMPLSDRPILQVILDQLVAGGVEHVTISVGHLGGLIESWVAHHDAQVPVELVHEDAPLGTAGALRLLPRRPEETFLALNGDVLTTLDFAELVRRHREGGAIATMAINERTVDVQYGVVYTDDEGRITRLDEKPQLRYRVSMGVYAMEPAIIDHIGDGERIDFPTLLLRAVERGGTVRAFEHTGYWRDIGNRDDYEAAIDEFTADPARFGAADEAP